MPFSNLNSAVGNSGSHPGYRSGIYYQAFNNVISLTAATTDFSINSISYYLFRIHHEAVLNRIAINVNGAVTGANLRLGIFSNNNGLPQDLLIDGGNIIAATVGAKEAIISLPVTPSDYWLGGITTTPPNLQTASAFLGTNYDLGQSTPSGLVANCGLRNALAATPTSLPSTAPIDNLQFLTGNLRPFFWFRTE